MFPSDSFNLFLWPYQNSHERHYWSFNLVLFQKVDFRKTTIIKYSDLAFASVEKWIEKKTCQKCFFCLYINRCENSLHLFMLILRLSASRHKKCEGRLKCVIKLIFSFQTVRKRFGIICWLWLTFLFQQISHNRVTLNKHDLLMFMLC